MTKQRTQLILLVFLGITVALAIFYVFKSKKLKQELQVLKVNETESRQELDAYHKMVQIDSMLVQGDYSTALQVYSEEFQNKDIEQVSGVRLRIDLAEKLQQLRAGDQLTGAAQAKLDSLDSIQSNRSALPFEVQRYDSLQFVLEKTKVQLASMKRQLKKKSFGEYLTFTNTKGSKLHYVGQVDGDKADGYGVAILNTGSRYEGDWKDNQRHGEGAFYWPDGEYYVGSYKNDRRNGKGAYYWPNGEKYIGEWKNDKRNGQGIFYGKDGEVVTSGMWKDDKLVNENEKKG